MAAERSHSSGGGSGGRVSHQLSSGLYVSGRREQYKDKATSLVTSSAPMPYTGGDVKKSGELGKMFDIPVVDSSSSKSSRKSGPMSGGGGYSRSGTFGNISSTSPSLSHSGPVPYSSSGGQNNRSGPLTGNILGGGARQASSHSGPLSKSGELGSASNLKTSGPLSSGGVPPTIARQNSGSLLPATGLITSGPLSSSGAPKKKASGPLDSSGVPLKYVNSAASNPAVNKLVHDGGKKAGGIPKVILWTVIPLFIVGFVAGGFIFVTVQNSILLIVVGSICVTVVLFLMWNSCSGRKSIVHFLASHNDIDLQHAKDGQYVKVTGVVTCGSVPLESSYQKVGRCIYTSTGLYEYRGLKSKEAKKGHRHFTWGLRYLERHVADFYISDFQSGLRALVKSGYTAAVLPLVEESTVVDISLNNREVPNNFLRWVGERNLSVDDRMMRLKEGYIKEGSTVTVMGVVQRHENVLMIVPSRKPMSTGCQWRRLLLPKSIDGLLVYCDETCTVDAVPL